jgi:hypothetical protein
MYLLKKIKEYGVVDVTQEDVPETGKRDLVRRVTDFTDVADIFGMVKMQIDIGEKDGLKKIDLFDVLSNQLRISDMDIGSMIIDADQTTFEVQKIAASKALTGIGKTMIKGKKPNVKIIPIQKGEY